VFAFVKPLILILFTLWTMISFPVMAEDADGKLLPLTSTDPKIPLDELDIMIAPLTVMELKAEADGWLELVKASAHRQCHSLKTKNN